MQRDYEKEKEQIRNEIDLLWEKYRQVKADQRLEELKKNKEERKKTLARTMQARDMFAKELAKKAI